MYETVKNLCVVWGIHFPRQRLALLCAFRVEDFLFRPAANLAERIDRDCRDFAAAIAAHQQDYRGLF
jgi:hypothetical protein